MMHKRLSPAVFCLSLLFLLSCQPAPIEIANKATPEPTPDMSQFDQLEWKGRSVWLMIPKGWTQTLDRDNLKAFSGPDGRGGQANFSASYTRDLSKAQADGLISNYRSTYTSKGTEAVSNAAYSGFTGVEIIEKEASLTGGRRHIFSGVRPAGSGQEVIHLMCELKAANFDAARQLCAGAVRTLRTTKPE